MIDPEKLPEHAAKVASVNQGKTIPCIIAHSPGDYIPPYPVVWIQKIGTTVEIRKEKSSIDLSLTSDPR